MPGVRDEQIDRPSSRSTSPTQPLDIRARSRRRPRPRGRRSRPRRASTWSRDRAETATRMPAARQLARDVRADAAAAAGDERDLSASSARRHASISSSASGFSSDDRSPGSLPSAFARTARRTIFAAARLRQRLDEDDPLGPERLAELVRRPRREISRRSAGDGLVARVEDAEDPRDLALDVVRDADRGRLGDRRVRDGRRLELRRADPLARDVERVVASARAGTSSRPRRPTPSRRASRRPGSGASTCRGSARRRPRSRASSPATAACTRARRPRRARAGRRRRRRPCPWPSAGKPSATGLIGSVMQVGEEAGADLGAAGDVHDRYAAAADLLEEPQVRVAVPRLAGRADRAQRRHVGLGLAVRDQRADRASARRRASSPAPTRRAARAGRAGSRARPRRRRRSRRTAPAPTTVHGPMIQPMSVAKWTRSPRLDVGLVRDLARDRDEEAAVDVQRALRPAGRARRVREQVRVLRVDLPRGQTPGRAGDELVPAAVAAERHRHVVELEAAPDDRVRHGRRLARAPRPRSPSSAPLPAAQRAVGA